MTCDICGRIPHDARCPHYVDPTPTVGTCALCGEAVLEGEEIIRVGERAAHYDCVRYNAPDDEVLAFLGIQKEIA